MQFKLYAERGKVNKKLNFDVKRKQKDRLN